MKTSSILRRAIQAILPATLLLAACSKKDEPAAPAPDQGRIIAYHAAASANVGIKVLFDDADKGTLTYGQNSGYQAIGTGSHVVKVNLASSNANVLTKTVTVEKDKNYSYFVYANTATTAADLIITDDLATPSAGKAKIRLVNLALGAANPVKLSTTAASATDIAGTEAQFAAASGFVEILPGSYNVAVTSGSASTTVTNGNVGDGTGAGTVGNKTYEAGKIYTVIYRGITGTLVDPALQPKVVIVQNN